ncbi:C6 transcription factor [Colletotrichum sojae]|uniref:C6 transcription factor n=1 Tax=Colletotrichum sojae TaxID=2175907 RepID=A0A8H6IY87_9PEZI|nr:C6 transcription factor [Colletotrichum sojae]
MSQPSRPEFDTADAGFPAPDPVTDAVPSDTQFTSPSTAVGTTPDVGVYLSSFKTQAQERAGHSQGTPFGLDPSLRAIAESRLKPIQLNPFSSKEPTLFDETQRFWKRYLLSLLPTQTQADLLITYFFENINWIYHAVHAPSFRARYSELWAMEVEDVDLIWLALLYVVFSLSSLYISALVAEAAGFEVADLAVLSHRWYYIETLNSHLGQAIRNAQAMGLDKESPETITGCLEREIRHRVWWDLSGADTEPTDDKRSVATIVDGLRVLRRILSLLDERAYDLPQGGDHPVRLAPDISSVFGGEMSARKYLERCAIKYLGCDDGTWSQSDQTMCDAGAFDASSWEALLDPPA